MSSVKSLSAAAMLCVVLAPSALAGTIGVYADPECTDTELSIRTGETKTVYVGLVGEPLANGRNVPMVCEFAINGLPKQWTAIATTNRPGVPLLGEDILAGGGGVGFFSEYDASGSCVLLYTIELTATTDHADFVVRVEGGHAYDCPYFFVDPCRGPEKCPVEHCVDGGSLNVNVVSVGVNQNTWAGTKALYR